MLQNAGAHHASPSSEKTEDNDISFGSFTIQEHKNLSQASSERDDMRSHQQQPPLHRSAPLLKRQAADSKQQAQLGHPSGNGLANPPAAPSLAQGPAPLASLKSSTWASILSTSNQTETRAVENGPNGHVVRTNGHAYHEQFGPASLSELLELVSQLKVCTHDANSQVGRRQRGLVNTSNACFRNVVLQALLSCNTFASVLTDLQPALRSEHPLHNHMAALLPTWMQLTRLIAAFENPNLASGGMRPYRKTQSPSHEAAGKIKGQSRRQNGSLIAEGRDLARFRNEDIWLPSVRPDDFLQGVFNDFRSSQLGEQEDAQEFLAFFLDRLHEEALAACKKAGLQGKSGGTASNGVGVASGDVREAMRQNEDEGWQEVGKKGTRATVHSASHTAAEERFDSSAITRIFYGRLRSDLRRGGSRAISSTEQRFECLQLDITASQIRTVLDALVRSLSEELVSGGQKQQRLTKRMYLDGLPKVLILHLKRFTFDPARGPLKVAKAIEYPLTLELPTNLLTSNLRATTNASIRYQLYCVVLHIGRTIMGGHYTAYGRGRSPGEWFYYDDERVESVSEAQILRHREQVYLMFYQRMEAS